MHHFVVGQHQDIVLAGEVGETEGHLVVVVLTEIRIQLHVFQEVVHPSHVPLKGESKAVVLRAVGHHRPRGALFRDDHGAVLPAGDDGVQVLEELDSFQVLVPAVLVRAPVPAGSAVIKIEHGRDRVNAETVHVILVQPVERVRDQEVLYLCLLIVEDLGSPVRMLTLPGVCVLIAGLAVEIRQAEGVTREMRRHPVKDDADAVLVQIIHEILEFLRFAVAGGGSVISGHLVAPAAVKGVLRDTHELDVGVSHVLHIGREFMGKILVVSEAAALHVFFVPLPGAEVALVNAHGGMARVLLRSFCHPLLVVPGVVPGLHFQTGRCPGAEFRTPCVRIRFVKKIPRLGLDHEFIQHAGLQSGDEGLPDAAFKDLLAEVRLGIPIIEIADDADSFSVGCPYSKMITVFSLIVFRMGAKFFIDLIVSALTKPVAVGFRYKAESLIDDCHKKPPSCFFFRPLFLQLPQFSSYIIPFPQII